MKEPPVKPGDVLADKYLVESVLGIGGMGVVVEAIHLELHEARAIKLLLPEVLDEKESVERFLREARRSARLKSEHVVRVHDVDKLPSGAPYVVMELLQGSDLRRIIKQRGRIPVGEAVHYALQACEALAEAHAAGIVHRDLKPANLFLTVRNDGTPCVKVLDFGISKGPNDGDDELTKTQAVLGSPSYMSPEQMRSARTVDARTDIWSLGVILYRLTTGELPFRAETMAALVTKVLQTTPRRPSEIVPDLPPGLDEVLLRCLSRELPERYANVGELSTALLPFAPPEARASIERIGRVLAIASHGGGVLPAMPLPAPSPASRPARRRPPLPRRPRRPRLGHQRRLGQHLVRRRHRLRHPVEALGPRRRQHRPRRRPGRLPPLRQTSAAPPGGRVRPSPCTPSRWGDPPRSPETPDPRRPPAPAPDASLWRRPRVPPNPRSPGRDGDAPSRRPGRARGDGGAGGDGDDRVHARARRRQGPASWRGRQGGQDGRALAAAAAPAASSTSSAAPHRVFGSEN